MNLTEYIGQYEKAEKSQLKRVPAFFARLKIAEKLTNRDERIDQDRNLMTPYYLSDLGVRKLVDSKKYAEFIAEEFQTELPNSKDITEELLNIPLLSLKDWLDVTLLLTGDYDAIAEAVLKRQKEILLSHDYRLLLYSGTVLSALKNVKYDEFFRTAADLVTNTNEEYLVMLHRIAVSDLKRKADFDSFKKSITTMMSGYNSENYANFSMILGLMNNLYGLFLIKKADLATVELIMINADFVLQTAFKKEKIVFEKICF